MAIYHPFFVPVCLLTKTPTHSVFVVELPGGLRWTFCLKPQRKNQDALRFLENAACKKEKDLSKGKETLQRTLPLGISLFLCLFLKI